jgi:hypothetical protein
MLEGLPANLLSNLGAVSILGVAVLGVLRGWLVPGKSLDAMLAVHRERLDQERARGDEWKATAHTAIARADERDKQTEKLFEVVNVTLSLMETLRRTAEQAETLRRTAEQAGTRMDNAAARMEGFTAQQPGGPR